MPASPTSAGRAAWAASASSRMRARFTAEGRYCRRRDDADRSAARASGRPAAGSPAICWRPEPRCAPSTPKDATWTASSVHPTRRPWSPAWTSCSASTRPQPPSAPQPPRCRLCREALGLRRPEHGRPGAQARGRGPRRRSWRPLRRRGAPRGRARDRDPHPSTRLREPARRPSRMRFGPLGMPVEVVSELPGDAATLKLLRSVFMKGIAAAAIESLEAAEAAGRREWLEGQLAAVLGEPLLQRLVEGSRRHARAQGGRDGGGARPAARPSGSSRASRRRAPPCSPRWRPLRSPAGGKVAPMVTQPAEEVRPSERARVLVRGAYDLHVHIAPDVPPRRIDDAVARPPLRRARSRRLRAQVALHVHGRAGPGRLGGRARRRGGRDADAEPGRRRDERRSRSRSPRARAPASSGCRPSTRPRRRPAGPEPKPGDKVPQWARLQHELRGLGLGVEPVHVTGEDGQLLPGDARRAPRDRPPRADPRHRAPRPRRRVRRRRRRARAKASSTIVVTHPEFPCQNFSIDDQVALAERGCLLERCLSTPHSGKTTLGARRRRRPRGRRRAHPLLQRLRQPRLPGGRGRARALGRPPARRRLRRGRGPGA